MGNLRHLVFAASAGLVLAAAAPGAQAHVLSTPDIGAPDALSLGLGSTLLADTGLLPFATSVYAGTAREWVYANTANSWGSGDLTFIIQVTNAPGSKDALGRITAADFEGFKVDAGTLGVLGLEDPNFVTRNSSGDVIGFNYSFGLDAGKTSDFLSIDTNAKLFTVGSLSVIDSKTFDLVGYAPAVPEPSTWAMMLLGFAGLGYAGFRSRKTSVSSA